jgi:hypothetical protein
MLAAVAVAAFAGGQSGCGGGSNGSCTCPTIFAPVCGADGRTYSNSCVADCGKVAVAHEGECARDGGAGGQGQGGQGTGGHAGASGQAGRSGATCPGPAPPGCCLKDDDCASAQGAQICVTAGCTTSSVKAGVCKPQIPSDSTQCWSDADCFGTERCVGAQVCPCGAACLVADEVGHCVK